MADERPIGKLILGRPWTSNNVPLKSTNQKVAGSSPAERAPEIPANRGNFSLPTCLRVRGTLRPAGSLGLGHDFEGRVPYDNLGDLPDSVRNNLPKHAQEVYRGAHNSAEDPIRRGEPRPPRRLERRRAQLREERPRQLGPEGGLNVLPRDDGERAETFPSGE